MTTFNAACLQSRHSFLLILSKSLSFLIGWISIISNIPYLFLRPDGHGLQKLRSTSVSFPLIVICGTLYVLGDNCFATCIKGQRPQRWVSIAKTIYFESLVIAQHVYKHDCTRPPRRSRIRRCCRHWSELSRYHLCSELKFGSSSLPL